MILLLFAARLLGDRRSMHQRFDGRRCFLQPLRVLPAGHHAGELPQEVEQLLILVRGLRRGGHRHQLDYLSQLNLWNLILEFRI